jgi:hypothetical protein
VRGATVVELTEESYPWVKPLLDQRFTGDYVGQGSRGTFGLSDRAQRAGDSMGQFYGRVIAAMIQRAAILYEVAMSKP